MRRRTAGGLPGETTGAAAEKVDQSPLGRVWLRLLDHSILTRSIILYC